MQSAMVICQEGMTLTEKGLIASKINELNCLVLSEVINEKLLDDISITDFITYLSLFIPIRVNKEIKKYRFETYGYNDRLCDIVYETETKMKYYNEKLINISVGYDDDEYDMHYDIYELVNEWCDSNNEQDAKAVLNKCVDMNIFIGEFIKCLLKIVNVSNELNSIAVNIHNVNLQFLTSQVEEKILKFVATNQSLYI
jgi:superfamily II RNA helicase